ncbi:MAG: hypothetical protein KTR20_00995 [Cellvibrionaceae bacterium]|nr:hypothetical protein [Cellvibrionaceae bacterium]
MITIPADGNWFDIPFRGEKAANGQLLINAHQRSRGLYNDQYRVDFKHTRAVYLRAYYEHSHPKYHWPFIHWQVRTDTYGSDANQTLQNIAVKGFDARSEIACMLETMTQVYPVNHLLHSCTPAQRHLALCRWASGTVEKLGYHHVEFLDQPESANAGIHWFKHRGERIQT